MCMRVCVRMHVYLCLSGVCGERGALFKPARPFVTYRQGHLFFVSLMQILSKRLLKTAERLFLTCFGWYLQM